MLDRQPRALFDLRTELRNRARVIRQETNLERLADGLRFVLLLRRRRRGLRRLFLLLSGRLFGILLLLFVVVAAGGEQTGGQREQRDEGGGANAPTPHRASNRSRHQFFSLCNASVSGRAATRTRQPTYGARVSYARR